MKVCLAEKPSVAREIAQVIGADRRMDGYYEGNGYQVTWTFGHFCQLKEPDDYRPEWKRWNLHDLPMIPDAFGIKLMRRDEGVVKQFNTIKRLLDAATEVINCGDAGQEGEVIQRPSAASQSSASGFRRLPKKLSAKAFRICARVKSLTACTRPGAAAPWATGCWA
jgi:DNA topoisomerase-3